MPSLALSCSSSVAGGVGGHACGASFRGLLAGLLAKWRRIPSKDPRSTGGANAPSVLAPPVTASLAASHSESPFEAALYAEVQEEGAARVNGRPLKKNDLMIFEDESGGRCIRIQAACPDHVCIAIFSGAEHLHCNVFPNSPEPRTPGHTLLRIVPYTLRGIKKFADAVENDPELWQEVLDGDFDAGLRDRFERFAKHRASPPAR